MKEIRMLGNGGVILIGGKPKDLERNLFQCHYLQYKSHIELSGLKPGP